MSTLVASTEILRRYADAVITRQAALTSLVLLGYLPEEIEETLAEHDSDHALSAEVSPDPCTEAAIHQGCECTVPVAGRWDMEPPEPRVSASCPLHGRDPDHERARRAERIRMRDPGESFI